MDEKLFIEHYNLKQQVKNAEIEYKKIQEKRDMLFLETQPRAVEVSDDIIVHNVSNAKYIDYCAQVELYDAKVLNARNSLNEKQYYLKKKEIELRESKDIYDQVYVMKFLDRKKVLYIMSKLNYSRPSIYKLIKKIEKDMKE